MDNSIMLQGLSVVLIGQSTVFANLIVLMFAVMVLGRIFGKKPEKKTAPPSAVPKDKSEAAPSA